MTSKQLFPSSPEQLTLTAPGAWTHTKKRGQHDDEILRDGASAVAALKTRRSAKGLGRRATPKNNTTTRSTLMSSSLEMSELTRDPTFSEVPEYSVKNTEYSNSTKNTNTEYDSDSEDKDFVRKRKRSRRKEGSSEHELKTDSNQGECEISIGTMGTMNTCSSISYSALAKRCVLLEQELKAKNKLINHYRTKIGEIVHSAIDTLTKGE